MILGAIFQSLSHVFVLGVKKKKKKNPRFLDENIPEVCFGNICKVIPDLNNIFKGLLHSEALLVALMGEATWLSRMTNSAFQTPDTCSCHCSGADLTRGYRATLVKPQRE